MSGKEFIRKFTSVVYSAGAISLSLLFPPSDSQNLPL